MTDQAVAFVAEHHYFPSGDEMPSNANGTSNTGQFNGHERDSETGLDYMFARYYSSSLGRFMAVDPGDDTSLDDPQSWNKYVYVRNNPLKFIDPNGEEAFLCSRPLFDNPRSSSQHMFVVSYAPALGQSSADTQVYSYGRTDQGTMGRVDASTTNFWSGGTSATDTQAWATAGQAGSTTACTQIPATDAAVSTSAEAVMETTTYSAIGNPAVGLNSNSAAQAVANDAAGAPVPTPGTRSSPGAGSADLVKFDKNGDGKPDPKTATPQKKPTPPPSRDVNTR